ncbi:CPBP family intramembrane glutamic endopeptidase [Secundilactobacillus paracollinoides]|uniref:CPBP family intramembrane glutamic endopeptidase n=1 Tax=Secundilactobacillus paracollinoides TaxID=240427 RepID=UPI0006F05EB2|nr:CPBP family intramembrane glutamic endopeptidase [Secundilactobacillus paracollinoides]KRL76504.1 immunity protein PlnI [Secundilactobacillus paracollinoides DSM 15502 = JCM 11969]
MDLKHERRKLFGQYGYFLLLWFVIQVFYNTPISNLNSGWTEEALLDSVKFLIWFVFGAWLIHHTRKQLAIERPYLFNWRFKPFYYWLAAIIVYFLVVTVMQHHQIAISPKFKPEYFFQDFLIVGICEETMFRGYFLNLLLKLYDNEQTALIIQAVMFAGIHLPRYFTTYPTLSALTIITNLITVGLLGYLFGWLFVKSHSLWPGIVTHSVWDLLVVALIGG